MINELKQTKYINTAGVQWENDCKYIDATIVDFNEWLAGECSLNNPLRRYEADDYWCYADYKHMAKIFKDKPHNLKVESG